MRQGHFKSTGQLPETLVRFQSSDGEGILQVASDFLDLCTGSFRWLRSRTRATREMESILTWLRGNTNPPPCTAYSDTRNRFPYTWYKASAVEHVRRAERLCVLLQREGVDILRIETRLPVLPLWQDDIQVVIRRPRSPKPNKPNVYATRVKNRIAKQRKRRERAGRVKARALKSWH